MSLSEFVERPAIREAFQAYSSKVALPFRPRDTPLVVESCGRRHSFVATAFDYVARFQTGRALCMGGPDTAVIHDCGWTAEKALDLMADDSRYASQHPRWCRYVEKGRELYYDYLGGADVPLERVVNCAQFMAAADMLVRTGEFRPDTRVDPDVTQELVGLASIFDPGASFPFRRACLLNPSLDLGEAVGGADAAIIVDGLLIDIKTTISPGMNSGQVRKLAGYAVLHALGGISLAEGARHEEPITDVALYFSRHGKLARWRIDDVFPHDGLKRFTDACRDELQCLSPASAPGPG